jgi:hypothetical protein
VVRFRPDLRVPTITVITETDLVGTGRQGFYVARQPDGKHLRTWEIPGTAHADTYTLQVAPIDTGSVPIATIAAAYKPADNLMGMEVSKPINFAPHHHYVVQAAVVALNRWVATGRAAPTAQPITLTPADPPALVLDAGGHAQGGIRTPWVDVPAARLSGTGNDGNIMAALFGSSEAFDAATLARLYPGGKPEYLRRFRASLDAAIRKGFLLAADRAEMLQLAEAMYPTSP